jgi:hypothetical protein
LHFAYSTAGVYMQQQSDSEVSRVDRFLPIL